MSEEIHYLTPEGLSEHEERLNFLRNVRRQQVAERLRLALEEAESSSKMRNTKTQK